MSSIGELGPRVLIVDDDVALALLWADRLERVGFETLAAFDPLEALAVAPSFRPDLALLDIGLPGIDGHELGSRLRSLDPKLPIITVTGDDTARKGERSDALGFDAHLVKPVRLYDLERMVRVALTARVHEPEISRRSLGTR